LFHSYDEAAREKENVNLRECELCCVFMDIIAVDITPGFEGNKRKKRNKSVRPAADISHRPIHLPVEVISLLE